MILELSSKAIHSSQNASFTSFRPDFFQCLSTSALGDQTSQFSTRASNRANFRKPSTGKAFRRISKDAVAKEDSFQQFFQYDLFKEWAQKYGSVFSVMKGTCPYIVVNDQSAARELFTKLGQNTSSRPYLPTESIVRGDYQPAMTNGPIWRVARRQ